MKNILIIGMGKFGEHLALKLKSLGDEVCIVDDNAEKGNQTEAVRHFHRYLYGRNYHCGLFLQCNSIFTCVRGGNKHGEKLVSCH